MADEASLASFADGFDAALSGLPGRALTEARQKGMAAFQAQGVPGRRLEAWKFTDLRRFLSRHAFGPAPTGLVDGDVAGRVAALGSDDDAARLVFLNGRLVADLSALPRLPHEVTVSGLANALAKPDGTDLVGLLGTVVGETEDTLIGLNAAWMEDGFMVDVPEGIAVPGPIRIVHVIQPGEDAFAVHPRHVISLGATASATIIEDHIGGDGAASFVNAVTEVALAEGASLRHYRNADGAVQGLEVQRVHAHVARDARFESFALAIGGQLTRHESVVTLTGPAAEAHVGGAYLGRDRQHRDNTILVQHDAPNCLSRQVFKGVLDDRARGVFQGKIKVDRLAQKTDGHQLNKSLLLSRGAEIDAKPELEIYADDVKCSHGATAGEIDGDALFYLRSRGVPETAARRLLVQAFLAEALTEISDDGVRGRFGAMVDIWMTEEFSRKDAA
ncbi:MAG: Fe-S cluster assembly protein SufD [Pseudomonadota bacterium]